MPHRVRDGGDSAGSAGTIVTDSGGLGWPSYDMYYQFTSNHFSRAGREVFYWYSVLPVKTFTSNNASNKLPAITRKPVDSFLIGGK